MNKQDLRAELNVKQRDFDACCKRLGASGDELSPLQEAQLRKLIGFCADGVEFEEAVRKVLGQEFSLMQRYNIDAAAETISDKLLEAIDGKVTELFRHKLEHKEPKSFQEFINGFML